MTTPLRNQSMGEPWWPASANVNATTQATTTKIALTAASASRPARIADPVCSGDRDPTDSVCDAPRGVALLAPGGLMPVAAGSGGRAAAGEGLGTAGGPSSRAGGAATPTGAPQAGQKRTWGARPLPQCMQYETRRGPAAVGVLILSPFRSAGDGQDPGWWGAHPFAGR